jgi:hypothetical protein
MLSLITLLLGVHSAAYAKTEIVSRILFKNEAYRITSDLYYDKELKKVDLWFDYEQLTGKPEKRTIFQATSLPSRYHEAPFKLVQAPVSFIDGQTIVIFDAHDKTTNDFNPDRGVSLLFRYPIENLQSSTVEYFLKQYPKSIVMEGGKPKYVKCVLTRVTDAEVYPLAAFDIELEIAPTKKLNGSPSPSPAP